jgi:hypothetical protein
MPASLLHYSLGPDARRSKRKSRLLGVVTGSGRCGTNSLAHFLNGQHTGGGLIISAKHETDWREITNEILAGRMDTADARLDSFTHDIEVSPFISLWPTRPLILSDTAVRLIALIRDGRQSVRSGMTNGWYWNPDNDPTHSVNLQPDIAGDRFEKCCKFWTWTYRRLSQWGARIVRFECLTAVGSERAILLDEFGLTESDRPFLHKNRTEYPRDDGFAKMGDGTWPSPFPPFTGWTRRQHSAFEKYCGELMDKYYSHWREVRDGLPM